MTAWFLPFAYPRYYILVECIRRNNIIDKGTFLACVRSPNEMSPSPVGPSPVLSIALICTPRNLHPRFAVLRTGTRFQELNAPRTSNISRDGQLSRPRRGHLSSYLCRHFCFSMPLTVSALAAHVAWILLSEMYRRIFRSAMRHAPSSTRLRLSAGIKYKIACFVIFQHCVVR